VAQQTKTFSLKGGLDLVTPPTDIPPGRLIGVQNYEPSDEGGYRRIAGHERFDGLPSPSEANYWYVNFDAGTTLINAADILDGITSGTSSEVLSVVVTSGDWGTNDAAGYIVVFNADGLYTDDEDLQVSAASVATADGLSAQSAADNDEDHETHTRAAREARRADIGAVPGSGAIRGVWPYKGIKYAIRDNAGATAGIMYASSATGWQEVDLGESIAFTAGTAEFLEGEVVTGSTSTAFGTIVAVGVTSGTWSGNDAAGNIYIKTITGTFQSETITSALGSATCSSAQAAVTLPIGGHYEFVNYNFGGQEETTYMWGCSGVGRILRFDGTDFAFNHVTGATLDMPRHIEAHNSHFFATLGSSVIISSIGTPMIWNAITGAAEIATGDGVVGMDVLAGDVMAIYNEGSTYLLYGSDAATWDLRDHSRERGAIEYSLQNVTRPLYMDDRGINYLTGSDTSANYVDSTISEIVDPLIQAYKGRVVSSVSITEKRQYRVFFDNNTALICRLSGKNKVEFGFIDYGMVVRVSSSGKNADGIEEVFFGSDDGYIYQAEKGDSFDGEMIEYFLRLPFVQLHRNRQKCRVHKVTFLLNSSGKPVLSYLPEFSYGNADIPVSTLKSIEDGSINAGGGYWGDALWGEFIWDGPTVGEADAYIDGQGFNISITLRGESNYEPQHTVQGCIYHYTPRGLRR
jgi:hypothetical protein